VDGADKTGTRYEDAIEDAIIAMNEPKDLSVTGLRNYLGEYHKEYNTDQRPRALKTALDNSEARGHLKRITGKGFAGTFRLMYPFYPSPFELWGEEAKVKKEAKKRPAKDDSSDDESEAESEDEPEYKAKPTKRGAIALSKKGAKVAPTKRGAKVAKKETAAKKPAPKYKDDSSEDESEAESEPEYKPKATKRGAPKARANAVAKKVKKSAPEKKAKKAAPVKKPVAKKSPAKGKRKGRK
jgi:hypothetical protein